MSATDHWQVLRDIASTGATATTVVRNWLVPVQFVGTYRDADKSLARLTSRCILFDAWNILFDASLDIYIYIYVCVCVCVCVCVVLIFLQL